MPPRKTKLRAKATSSSDSSSSSKWTALEDPKIARRLRVNEGAKRKWDRAQPRAPIKTHVPIAIDETLATADVLEIGTTLLDEFDPADLDLEFKIDVSCFTPATDRAPGVSNEQIENYTELLQGCSTPPASFAAMKALLEGAEAESEAADGQPHIDAEAECMIPLAWFVDAMNPLPFIDAVKEMYYDAAIILAVNSAKKTAGEVWRHVAAVHAARKQDLADYLWHARQIDRPADGDAKRAKRGE